jgi:diaminopimelate decarboxylase
MAGQIEGAAMDCFEYRDGQLFGEDVNLDELASQFGTPLYVYSRRTLEDHYDKLARAFAPLNPLICYSIKSSGNIHLVKLLADRGAGMDVVSGGELHRAMRAGVPASKIVFAGVGKTDEQIIAALEAGIGYFNVESEPEFENLAQIARERGTQARAALRVNPDVDAETHAKTTTGKKETKFGVDIDQAMRFFENHGHNAHARLDGIHLHLGSPIYSFKPYERAIERAIELIDQLAEAGITIKTLNIGGGYGADYKADQTPAYEAYAEHIVPLLQPFVDGGGRVILEPGRTISCNAGVLLARVLYIKTSGRKKFIIVDAGMNDLVRPAMYDAFHFIWPTNVAPNHVPAKRAEQMTNEGLEPCDVVGPICETGDRFAAERRLPPVARGDLLCLFSAGAYGMVMASNYNAVPRPAEVLIEADRAKPIRRRETYEDLVRPELQIET